MIFFFRNFNSSSFLYIHINLIPNFWTEFSKNFQFSKKQSFVLKKKKLTLESIRIKPRNIICIIIYIENHIE